MKTNIPSGQSSDTTARRLRWIHQSLPARFIIVGVINTAFSYFLYALLIFLGLHYALANLLALIAGILFSFRTQGAFVFENTEMTRLWRFVLAWALIYLVSIGLIRMFLSLGLNAYAAGALTLPASAILSYLAQKHFVFRRRD